MDPIGLLADDLDDANACAEPFAERGVTPTICAEISGPIPKPGNCKVLVVAAGATNLAESERRHAIRSATLAMRQAGWPLAFKLVDLKASDALAADVEELLRVGITRIWIARKFVASPLSHRQEKVPIYGESSRDTSAKQDSLAQESADLVAYAFGPECGPIGRVGVDTLSQGRAAIANQVRFERARDCRVIVCDASTHAHLALLAQVLRASEMAAPRELLVGSGSLVRALAEVLCSRN